MANEHHIGIVISWKTDDGEAGSITPSVDDYFDLDDGEQVELDSCPRFMHALIYLEQSGIQNVKETHLTVRDHRSLASLEIVENYWGLGHSSACRMVRASDGKLKYFESIVLFREANSEIRNIARFVGNIKEGEIAGLTPVMHVRVIGRDGEPQREEKLL